MTNIRKAIERTAGRRFVVIDIELRENDPRGLSDGFSVTGAVYEPHGTWSGAAQFRNGRYPDASGCVHNEILAVAPKLAPLVAVHLADLDGTPMHAAANGWYFYSDGGREYELRTYGADYVARQGTAMERAARALHIDPSELPAGMDRAAFGEFVESLRPRWAQMAADARALLISLS